MTTRGYATLLARRLTGCGILTLLRHKLVYCESHQVYEAPATMRWVFLIVRERSAGSLRSPAKDPPRGAAVGGGGLLSRAVFPARSLRSRAGFLLISENRAGFPAGCRALDTNERERGNSACVSALDA